MAVLVVMGVSGSGKTTIGRMLAKELGWRFYEGDEFHSPASIAKMEEGIPLTDEDREPWLERLRGLIQEVNGRCESALLTCSALRRAYREHLTRNNSEVRFVYLKGDMELIAERLRGRKDHFMRVGMLKSQFAILEEPIKAIVVHIDQPPEAVVKKILDRLGFEGGSGH